MAKDGRPPRFKPFSAPLAVAAKKQQEQRYRGSAQERGYDSRWKGISLRYRRLNPFCQWCDQENRETLTDLVDHMIPVADRPDLVHDWKNIWSLCKYHHGRKYLMEEHARVNDMLDMLPMWCREPDKRPAQFRAMEIK